MVEYFKLRIKRRYKPSSQMITLYHTSSPTNRNNILLRGLLPKVGDSYSLMWRGVKEPRIFLGAKDIYDSTYDDDRYMITIPSKHLELFIDTAMADGVIRRPIYYYVNKPIHRRYIKLFYRGTGESTF